MGLLGSDQATILVRRSHPDGAPASVRQGTCDQERDGWLAWAEHHLGIRPAAAFDRDRAMPLAVKRDDKLAAVVVYSHWRAGSVEMTIASTTPRWASREVIAFLLRWPFDVLSVRRITVLVATRNTRSRKLVEGVGFVIEGLLKAGFEDDDALLYGMTRERWAALDTWSEDCG